MKQKFLFVFAMLLPFLTIAQETAEKGIDEKIIKSCK